MKIIENHWSELSAENQPYLGRIMEQNRNGVRN